MEHVFKKRHVFKVLTRVLPKHVFKGLTRVLVKHVFTGLTRVLVGLLNMCLSAVTRVLELKHVFKDRNTRVTNTCV